jgi:hypothetical protein
MSREREELLRLARDSKVDAGAHLRRLTDGAARTSASMVRRHPWLVAGGAVALGALFTASASDGSQRRVGRAAHAKLYSWSIGLGALALRLLPTVLRVGAFDASTASGCASNGSGSSSRPTNEPSR